MILTLLLTLMLVRDLPILVPSAELNASHDNVRIVLSGVITDKRIFMGRMGDSKYFLTYIGDVALVTTSPVNFKIGDAIYAQGRYQHDARLGGYFFSQFMLVEPGKMMKAGRGR